MDIYTRVMEQRAFDAATDYYPREIIVEAVNSFHKFSDSLDIFIGNHGYTGNIDDIIGKSAFLRSLLKNLEFRFPGAFGNGTQKEKELAGQRHFRYVLHFILIRKKQMIFSGA